VRPRTLSQGQGRGKKQGHSALCPQGASRTRTSPRRHITAVIYNILLTNVSCNAEIKHSKSIIRYAVLNLMATKVTCETKGALQKRRSTLNSSQI